MFSSSGGKHHWVSRQGRDRRELPEGKGSMEESDIEERRIVDRDSGTGQQVLKRGT
jgi:hypothetical protein